MASIIVLLSLIIFLLITYKSEKIKNLNQENKILQNRVNDLNKYIKNKQYYSN